MMTRRDRQVTAVLGPTNTGKTHLAIDRMLGHASGVMGFPLRLLARENYDKVVRLKGAAQVALLTGEEKIVPPRARYFLCTVESMPLDKPSAFLAVDEVQLAADPERGHVFTDRLLHSRGFEETMFLGSDTVQPLLKRLVPEATVVSRPRFSTLSYAGARKLTRLPPRSAVVAFSAAEVYGLAELIRRQRGGTAVVLGALSPRTRNAQVEMFESGEVDYLVATDAIGMGLNLGLDHVAFARLNKFDGHAHRRLRPPEIAQIAGRAGRHMTDGTFGTTAELGAMDPETVEAVEAHAFEPLTQLFWRSRELDFASPEALLASLEARPERRELIRVRPPEDQQALAALLRDPEIRELAGHRGAVALLWEVCQVPDFRKTLSEQHSRLLGQVFRHLSAPAGRLPEDWVAQQIQRIDRVDGDIDALVARIAHIRTWTFVTHRVDWLEDAGHWQERARRLEDRLSDALHERLTQRFVDRRTATLSRRLRSGEALVAAVRRTGEVLVEGEHVGRLEGFRFQLDRTIEKHDAPAVMTATRRALQEEMPRRTNRLEADDDGCFRLEHDGAVSWRGAEVGRLARGDSPLRPRVRVHESEFLDGRARERVRLRLQNWLNRHLRNRLGLLYDLEQAALAGAARGLAFQLAEAMGALPRGRVAAQAAVLERADRKALQGLGVRLGAASVFVPGVQTPPQQRFKAQLWSVFREREVLPPPSDRIALPAPEGWDEATALALGFRLCGRPDRPRLAVRLEALERLAVAAHKAAPVAADGRLAETCGLTLEQLPVALGALGFRPGPAGQAGDERLWAPKPKRDKRPKAGPRKAEVVSPFAALAGLKARKGR
ncbi:MAG: helicase-related protein [Tistlia sp.]|uniref:helicase-related protein n=1 Tax=Tistlia sp. TaxID=3057121 RepID=UPI0034A14A16